MAQNQAAGICDLVIEKFSEVLLIHLALLGIYHCGKAVQLYVMGVDVLHGTDNVAQLADAGRFDQNAIRMILFQHLFQCLAEIAHQAAADTAGVHLGDLYAGILQKAAVNADLAEFVFDQHQLFAYIALTDQLLNQSGFAGAQKAGEYCNFCHCILHFFLFNVSIRNAFFHPPFYPAAILYTI